VRRKKLCSCAITIGAASTSAATFHVTKSKFAGPSSTASANAKIAKRFAASKSSHRKFFGLSLVQNRNTAAITGTMNTAIGASRYRPSNTSIA
jgi:hypothetical protein